MAFKYSHKDAAKVFPAGDYEAVIEKAFEGTSKSSGNPMQTVVFRVYGPGGAQMVLSDYIVSPGTIYKLKQIAKAIGKLAEFDADTFDVEKNIGANLVLELTIEDADGDFPEKNRIKKYKVLDRAASGKPVTVTPTGADAKIDDSSIPF